MTKSDWLHAIMYSVLINFRYNFSSSHIYVRLNIAAIGDICFLDHKFDGRGERQASTIRICACKRVSDNQMCLPKYNVIAPYEAAFFAFLSWSLTSQTSKNPGVRHYKLKLILHLL